MKRTHNCGTKKKSHNLVVTYHFEKLGVYSTLCRVSVTTFEGLDEPRNVLSMIYTKKCRGNRHKN